MEGWDIKPTEIKQTKPEIDAPSGEEIKSWFSDLTLDEGKICAMVYGMDGTMKSGLVLSYVKLLKSDEKMVVIDLDGGDLPIIRKYYPDKLKQFLHINPIVLDGNSINYKETYDKIRYVVDWVKKNYKDQNIKAIVFDGLSTALTYAENQMRIEKHISIEGGVNMAFWKIRNKYFIETLEQIKSIPIARFFIAHEDFIAEKEEQLSTVKQKTNQMMFQKILTYKDDNAEKVVFRGIIHKSKYNIRLESKEYVLAEVDKATNNIKFQAEKVWKDILE